MDITTDTHKITASYSYEETYQWYDLDVNGFTMDEVVADMLEFWNDHPDTVDTFTPEDPDIIDGEIVVGISGSVRADDLDGFPSETEVYWVSVVVAAEPLDNVT